MHCHRGDEAQGPWETANHQIGLGRQVRGQGLPKDPGVYWEIGTKSVIEVTLVGNGTCLDKDLGGSHSKTVHRHKIPLPSHSSEVFWYRRHTSIDTHPRKEIDIDESTGKDDVHMVTADGDTASPGTEDPT